MSIRPKAYSQAFYFHFYSKNFIIFKAWRVAHDSWFK